jgi:hypothetical protein
LIVGDTANSNVSTGTAESFFNVSAQIDGHDNQFELHRKPSHAGENEIRIRFAQSPDSGQLEVMTIQVSQ